jgi:hypothetical protein
MFLVIYRDFEKLKSYLDIKTVFLLLIVAKILGFGFLFIIWKIFIVTVLVKIVYFWITNKKEYYRMYRKTDLWRSLNSLTSHLASTALNNLKLKNFLEKKKLDLAVLFAYRFTIIFLIGYSVKFLILISSICNKEINYIQEIGPRLATKNPIIAFKVILLLTRRSIIDTLEENFID